MTSFSTTLSDYQIYCRIPLRLLPVAQSAQGTNMVTAQTNYCGDGIRYSGKLEMVTSSASVYAGDPKTNYYS
jgi:hypothetical protein